MAAVVMSFDSPLSSFSFSVSVLRSTKSVAASPVSISRFPFISTVLISKSFTGLSFRTPIMTMRKASIEIKDGAECVSESDDEEKLLLDNCHLDPKLQQKLEHKMRIKLAKNIRLRGKKLVRIRRMRKKGRWPLSKANKLKDV